MFYECFQCVQCALLVVVYSGLMFLCATAKTPSQKCVSLGQVLFNTVYFSPGQTLAFLKMY